MGELSISKELIIGALSTVQEPDLKKGFSHLRDD